MYAIHIMYTNPQVCFFPSHLLSSPLFSLLPSRNSDPGWHSRLFSPLPITVRALHFIARMCQLFLPSSTRVDFKLTACTKATISCCPVVARKASFWSKWPFYATAAARLVARSTTRDLWRATFFAAGENGCCVPFFR